MKSIPCLAVALATWLALSTGVPAQQSSCPTCPARPAASAPCPAETIEECPAEGCGGWDRQLNCRRNLTCSPSGPTAEPYTLDRIKKLPYPQSWHVGKDRAELAALGEGRHVTVTARLWRVDPAPPDAANCKLPGREDRSILLTLVPDGALGKKRVERDVVSVTAVLTPRVRRARRQWTQDSLGRLLSHGAPYVRVTGLLLLNTEGPAARFEYDRANKTLHAVPTLRATDWEIHPVLELEVCSSKQCAEGGGWQKLDAVKLPPWRPAPAGRRGEAAEAAEPEEAGPRIIQSNLNKKSHRGGRRRGRRKP